MRVYVPKKAKCQKCGGPLGFRLLVSGAWCPCNPDGSDHWDDCRTFQSNGTYGIKVEQINELFIGHTKPNHKRPLYSGEEPPWG